MKAQKARSCPQYYHIPTISKKKRNESIHRIYDMRATKNKRKTEKEKNVERYRQVWHRLPFLRFDELEPSQVRPPLDNVVHNTASYRPSKLILLQKSTPFPGTWRWIAQWSHRNEWIEQRGRGGKESKEISKRLRVEIGQWLGVRNPGPMRRRQSPYLGVYSLLRLLLACPHVFRPRTVH